jgi:cytochrome b involved in lipid metabolism
MKAVVIGAGISGLAVAQELVDKGFEVHVFEKAAVAGGMARSTRTRQGIPSEHSWRGYAPFYYNVFEIMSRIPITKKLQDKEIEPRQIVTFHGKQYDLTDFIPKHPGGRIIKKLLTTDDPLEKVWKDNNVEWHLHHDYVIRILEKYRVGSSVPPCVLDNLAKHPIDFKLLGKPAGIQWYDYPYLTYLFIKGAFVHKRKKHDTLLLDVVGPLSTPTKRYLLDYVSGPGFGFDKNTITTNHYFGFMYNQLYAGDFTWQVMNQPTSEAWIDPWVNHLKSKGVKFHFNSPTVTEVADEYISCIPPTIDVPNDQISFRIGFNRKITFDNKNLAFVLLDSPYGITFYAQDEHWSPDVDIGPVQSLWSGTITNGVEAVKLRPPELMTEIKKQILDAMNNIQERDIVYQELFEDWYWDQLEQRLKSKNPKWVNEIGELRPKNETDYPNVWIAGSHTDTTTDVWTMESAVESGKLASNLILKKYNLQPCFVKSHELKLAKIDDIFYDAGLPHVLDCILLFLFVCLLAS